MRSRSVWLQAVIIAVVAMIILKAYPLAEAPKPARMEPTAEEQAWLKIHFWDTLTRLTNTYPVEEVRVKLVEASIRANGRKEFGIFLSLMDNPNANPGYVIDGRAVWDQASNKPGILFYVPPLMRRYAEFDGHPESYEDKLISLYLHELYHVDHHPIDTKTQLPYDVRFQAESEAWWYTAERVLLPMVNGGRHIEPTNLTNRAAILSYVIADGDQSHPAWKQFVGEVTPR